MSEKELSLGWLASKVINDFGNDDDPTMSAKCSEVQISPKMVTRKRKYRSGEDIFEFVPGWACVEFVSTINQLHTLYVIMIDEYSMEVAFLITPKLAGTLSLYLSSSYLLSEHRAKAASHPIAMSDIASLSRIS